MRDASKAPESSLSFFPTRHHLFSPPSSVPLSLCGRVSRPVLKCVVRASSAQMAASGADSGAGTFAGIPFTAPLRWVVHTNAANKAGVTVDIQRLHTRCEFHHPHIRCCWTRTMLDARTAEACEQAKRQDPCPEQHVRQHEGNLLELVRKLASADSGGGGRVPRIVREIDFVNQPPPVIRVDSHGGIVYRVGGVLTLRSAAPGDGRFPLFLAIAADPSCRHLLQPDPPSGFPTRRGDEAHTGYPQLLLRQEVAHTPHSSTATYSPFRWLFSPLGNQRVSSYANVRRVKGISSPKRPRDAGAEGPAPPPPSAEVPLSFRIYASVFSSPEAESEARDRVALLDAPSSYMVDTRRFGLGCGEGSGSAATAPPKVRRLTPAEKRARQTEQKRIRVLLDFLDGTNEGGDETRPRGGPAALQHIAQLETSAPLPCERCLTPNEKTLASVLPSSLRRPPFSEAPPASVLTENSELSDLVAAWRCRD